MELKINGFDGASLGAIQTSFNFRLDAFKNPHLTYRIDLGKGKKPAQRTVDIAKTIKDAMGYIARNCAQNAQGLFAFNPWIALSPNGPGCKARLAANGAPLRKRRNTAAGAIGRQPFGLGLLGPHGGVAPA